MVQGQSEYKERSEYKEQIPPTHIKVRGARVHNLSTYTRRRMTQANEEGEV